MSGPKHTLAQIMEAVRQRPINPDQELAVVEFLDLSDSEQKNLLFRELCHQGAQINWLMAQLRK